MKRKPDATRTAKLRTGEEITAMQTFKAARTRTSKPYFKAGMKIDGYCDNCKAERSGTFNVGSYTIEETGDVVKGVMRATCDNCGYAMALAQDSAPLIKAALDNANAPHVRRERSSVKIPQSIADWGSGFLTRFGLAPHRYDELIKGFILGYHNASAVGKAAYMTALTFVDSCALEEPRVVKFNINFSDKLWNQIEELRIGIGLETTSELIRRILAIMMEETDALERDPVLAKHLPKEAGSTHKLAGVAHFEHDMEAVAMLLGQ